MTLLPTSEQNGDLDNIAVTRAEFRAEIGQLLEYLAQALGDVSGTYTTERVDPLTPILQGTPTLEIGAEPGGSDSSLRLVTSQWVKRSGRYVGSTAPNNPVDGMLWINNTTSPYTIQAFNGSGWDIISGVPSGTRMLFQQSTPPTGWTKVTSYNNWALRVTSGTVTTGGGRDFTDTFKVGYPTGGQVMGHEIKVDEMPIHSHGVGDPGHSHGVNDPGHKHRVRAARESGNTESGGGDDEAQDQNFDTNSATTGISINNATTGINIANTGGSREHAHNFQGAGIDLDVKYVDVIVAEKD